MKQIEHNQVVMKEEIDTIKHKIDQLLEMMLTQARKEEECHNVAAIGNVIPVQRYTSLLRVNIPNPLIYGLHCGSTPPTEGTPGQPQLVHVFMVTDGCTAQGHPTAHASNIPTPHVDEELQH